MGSWSYATSAFLANGTSLIPSDSFPENPRSMAGFQQGLSNDFDKDDVFMSGNGFSSVSMTKVASSSSSSSFVVPSSLLHVKDDGENQFSSSKLSRIDFKLRSFRDYGNYDGGTSSRAKKPRASSSCSQTPFCQVHGCNMDLSSSKDYHKRHRVCETHSKTSVVIVSGIEQRFCQQCSRFHFLSEFDDGKRSCRRRLAGHNERRRKPSFCFLSGKRHKLLHTSQGSKFLEDSSVNDLTPESFPGSFLYRVMDEHNHHGCASRLVNFKDEPMFPAQNMSYESKPAIYTPEAASGVSFSWDLHEAAPRFACAHSLLSAQSQQYFPETPNKTFSITQPNQSLNHSTIDYHKMQPLRTDLGKNKTGSSSFNGKGSSTVDLQQLSSHLQRIEQQQRSFTNDVKQEYNNEVYFPSS